MNKSKFLYAYFLYLLSGTARAVDINITITGIFMFHLIVVNNNILYSFLLIK